MKRAIVYLSPDLVAERLMLPAGSVIRGAEWDSRYGVVVLCVEHPDLPDVQPHEPAMTVTYTVRSEWSL